MGVAVGGRSDVEEGLALCGRVGVQQDLLRAAVPGRPRIDRMLGAALVAGVVGVGPVRGGHGAVVLLDAAAHLAEQLRLQRLGRGQHGGGVGVLRLQVRAHISAQDARVAHDLLPVRVLQPGVVVDAHMAELLDPQGTLGGRRRLERRDAGKSVIHGSQARSFSRALEDRLGERLPGMLRAFGRARRAGGPAIASASA